MRLKINLIFLLVLSFTQVFSQYYVSPTGSDANAGSISAPFKTIQKAASLMVAGDTCFIKAGIYHETVSPVNNGTSTSPIVFQNYMNDKVIITGTDSISNWTSYQNGVYKAYAPDTVLQVSVDKKIANEARYPNFRGNYMSLTDWKAVVIDTNSNATFTGMNFPSGYWVGGYVEALVGVKWVCHNGKINSSSGSLVHCNETSWPWGSHPAYGPTYYTGSGVGYITHHLNALDTINEWHWQNDTLYYYPQNAGSINTANVQVRTRMYGFTCYNKQYIQINNVHFMMATVNFEKATGCVLNGGSVLFPSPFFYYLRGWDRQNYEADNYGIGEWRGKGIAMSGYHNTVKNCYIAHSWGDGVSVGGQYNTVENCLIEDCDYAMTDCALITTVGVGHHVAHNTIRKAARSALVNRKSNITDILYNDMYECGLTTQDLGVTYTFQSNGGGSHIAYNWAHDNHASPHAMGIYLDNSDTAYNVHHNVVWNCGTAIQTNLTAKDHQIYNNSVWFCTNAMASYGVAGTSIINQIVKNNLSNKAWNQGTTFSNNLVTATSPFTDVNAFDFTLSANSPAINYGVHIPGFTNGYVGSAPDAGAYEYGQAPWIPGTTTMMPDMSEVYVNSDLPEAAKIITGIFTLCQGQQNVVFTAEPILNATSYIWTLPNGATGTTLKNTITVNFSNSAVSGNITVKGQNSNGIGISATRYITVNPFPAAAGSINGTDTVCFGLANATYSVSPIANATSYTWTLPTGATGSSTTNSISVNFGVNAVSGNITVKATNACGEGAVSILPIVIGSVLPADAQSISGLNSVCQGKSVLYSTPTIANASSYVWNLPTGAIGNSLTNTINVFYSGSASSGAITVKGSNNCGFGLQKSLSITVLPTPAAPVITLTADTLSSNVSFGNQWYNLANGLIPGADAQTFTPTQSGTYFSIVNLIGCPSDTSNLIYYNYIGINEVNNEIVTQITPNPSSGTFHIISNDKIQKIEVSDINGKHCFEKEYDNQNAIDLDLNVLKGTYFIKIVSRNAVQIQKIIKL